MLLRFCIEANWWIYGLRSSFVETMPFAIYLATFFYSSSAGFSSMYKYIAFNQISNHATFSNDTWIYSFKVHGKQPANKNDCWICVPKWWLLLLWLFRFGMKMNEMQAIIANKIAQQH